MARVNITVPDELIARSRAADLNVSRIATDALAERLDRREKVLALERYLLELDAEFGPIPDAEREAAVAWADEQLGRSTAVDVKRSA